MNTGKALILSVVMIFTFASCYCQSYCDSLINACCRHRYLIDVEFLFWQTCVNDLDFALRLKRENITPDSGRNCMKYKYSSPDFDGGIRGRIGIENIFCDWDFAASLTYLCANKSKELDAPSGGLALATLQHGDFNLTTHKVKGHYWLHYWESDYLFTNRYWLDRCYTLDPFFGLSWAIFDQNRGSRATVAEGDDAGACTRFKWQGDYWGVGMKAGSELRFHTAGSVDYFLRVSGSLLAGRSDVRSKQKVRQTGNRTTLQFKTEECLIAPGYHLLLGMHFHHQYCGKNAWVRCGYEFLNWHNIPSVRRFMHDGTDIGLSTSPSTSTLGFHGFFAGGGISF